MNSPIVFVLIALLAIFAAVMMITNKNPTYSILWLIVVFFCISGNYILLNAQFLAIVNIIVYAGAIMVLFLFVVMLMNLNRDNEPARNYRMNFISVISGGCLLLILLSVLVLHQKPNPVLFTVGDAGLIKKLGTTLFSRYVLPFELSSVLFLSAIVGAVVIGKRN